MELLKALGIVPMLIVTLCVCLGCDTVKTWFTRTKSSDMGDIHVYNVAVSIAAGLTILVMNGGLGQVSLYTVLLAVVFGIVTALGTITGAKAISCGPWSYTAMISSLSTIIPTLSGWLFWHEEFGLWRIIGVVLLLICFVLASGTDKSGSKASLKWMFWCVCLFFFGGSIGLLQKVHQTSEHSGELGAFLVIAFAMSAVFSVVNALICHRRSPSTFRWNVPTVLLAMLAGVFAGMNNEINLYLVGVVPTVVFFPVVNGGGLILTTLLSTIAFKERLSVKRWIGLAVGAAALVFICLLPVVAPI